MAMTPIHSPEIEPGKQSPDLRPAKAPQLNKETDGSVWTSLISNLRDAFSTSKQPPLQLQSRPVETTSLLEEGGVFASLWSSLRDVFFPEKLPPLHLESKPIAVVDRMAFKRNPASTAMAIAIYAVLILIIAYVQRHHLVNFADKALKLTELEAPPPVPPKKDLMGGGGGQKGPTPVSKGNLPKIVEQKIILPKIETPPVPTIDLPKDLKMPTVPLANLGDPNSPRVGMSMGNGNGTGIGSGTGGGLGPGSGGLTGGGVRHIGGGVLPPVVIYQVEPEFSEEARKAKFAGNVLVALYVDTLGRPVNVHIIRGVGMGLDEKAVEAVKQYKFKPAMENGKPVLVDLNIEVNFQIF
jgi:protein TonB